jgi:hypothetical protein
MNGNVLKNALDVFPQEMISSNGRHLYDMIEFFIWKERSSTRSARRSAHGQHRGVVPQWPRNNIAEQGDDKDTRSHPTV